MKHLERLLSETPPNIANGQPETGRKTKRELGKSVLAGLGLETTNVSLSYDQYLKNRQEGNRFLLAEAKKSEHNSGRPFRLLDIYDTLLNEGIKGSDGDDITRLLKSVNLIDTRNDDDEAYFESHEQYTDYRNRSFSIPTICMNFSNSEVYKTPNGRTGDLTGMDELFMEMSTKIGVSYEDMIDNETFCASFVFLHELGHAVDSMRELERRKAVNAHSLRINPTVMENTINSINSKRQRYEIESSPIVGISPKVRDSRYEAQGIDPSNPREKMLFWNRSYREMPDEHFADEFAYNFIMSHPSLFFTMNEDEKDTGRLYVHLGEKITVNEETAFCIGLREGRSVTLKAISNSIPQETNDKLSGRFYIARTPKVGQPLELSTTDNPNDSGSTVHETAPISDIYAITERSTDDDLSNFTLQTNYFVQLENGTRLSFKYAGRPLPRYYELEEMMDQIKINPGSTIQLLKTQDIMNGRSDIEQGDILSGTIPETGLKENIVLTDSNGNSHDISPVDTYRCWKTWFLRSDDSIFEVLPSDSQK